MAKQPISLEKKKHNPLGAAHLNPRDAYRDVPILKQPTWNNEVAAYFFFGGISAGAALIGSLAEVFGGERHRRLARTAHYVSFATLLPCPPLLIDDLGTPGRFHHMLRIIKPSSPMNVGSWALLIHGMGAMLTVMRMLAGEGKLPFLGGIVRLLPERALAGLGIPSSLVLAGYTGVLLGTTSVPVWHTSPLLGALFMSSSFTTGIAATSLLITLTETERQHEYQHGELAMLALVSDVTEAAVLMGYVATTGVAIKPLLSGQSRLLMVGAVAGLAVAALLELGLEFGSLRASRHKRIANILASSAALASGAMLRWAVVYAGRASAADREGTLEAMKPREGAPGWRQRASSTIVDR